MKTKFLTLMISLMLMTMMTGVYAYDADNPYTVTINYIVGEDTSFTAELAGAETTIDFNPTTIDSKEVEPDSQNAGTSTPILVLTNTGNVNIDFTHGLTATQASFVAVSWDTDNTVDWTQTLSDSFVTLATNVATSGTTDVYLWANFTSADAGTTQRTYQVNSSATS